MVMADVAVTMEDLRNQTVSLSKKLNALYESVEQICGVSVFEADRDSKRDIRPTSAADNNGQQQQQEGEQMALDRLRRQEVLLRQQIADLVAKLPVRRPQQFDEAATDGTATVAPAAEALRHFLINNGGETGGWDARDHGLFLQWRSRFRNNRQTFISAVCDTVPGKNSAQVESHERWYQNLQKLRREQRLELDEWKRKKKAADEEERKRALEAQQDPSAKCDNWVVEWRRQRATVREQLERWKENKAKAAEPVITEQSAELSRKKEQAEQRRRMDQQYQKLVAYLWRMEQEAARLATESADHFLARLARKQKSQSNVQLMVEQRQKRDREWLEQRRRQLLTRQQQQQPPKVSLRRRARSIPRDPQRLLRPTSSFMARLLPATDDEMAPKKRAGDAYILDVPSKTVPSWRQLTTGSQ